MSHIGVLKALEENDIHVDIIAGCSAGALVGSLYCCNIDAKTIGAIANNIDRKLWVDVTIPKRGFIKGQKVEDMIRLLTKNKNIEDLDKKLIIVSTDLKKGEKYVFTEGPIYRAVRASISIPGVFIPVRMNDMMLVDGAVIDRVPISEVKKAGADIVIGVDVGFSSQQGRTNHIVDIILQSIDVMAKQIMSEQMVVADVLLEPDVSHIGPSRFDLVEDCVKVGYDTTMEKIDIIKEKINEYKNT